jgi:hypothetical protein
MCGLDNNSIETVPFTSETNTPNIRKKNTQKNKQKTNKKELRNKACIFRPVDHDTSRVKNCSFKF